MTKIPADLHTHSTLSFDGENEPREVIERAIELGMKVIASTEHLDINVYYDKEYKNSVLIPNAVKIINDLKKEYRNDIKVIYGVEFAQGPEDVELAEKILEEYPFDFVLGSVHGIRGMPDFYNVKYRGLDLSGLMGKYLEAVHEMILWGKVDALAHLTYPLRYIIGREKLEFHISAHDEQIRKIFSLIIAKGIALEINTAGLRTPGYNRPDPDFSYLRIYREMGGELISVGSDAHRVSDLGTGLQEAIEKAAEYGFTKITYFENRTPCFLEIK